MSNALHANPNQSHGAAHDSALRKQLAQAIRGGEAHLDASAVFRDVNPSHWGAHGEGAPHTLWQLLKHTHSTLHDLYVFSTDPKYTAPNWPDDYWPKADGPASPKEAREALADLHDAQHRLVELIENPETDLFARIQWGEDQTILREALLAATHTSYHLGQAMFLRKLLETSTPS